MGIEIEIWAEESNFFNKNESGRSQAIYRQVLTWGTVVLGIGTAVLNTRRSSGHVSASEMSIWQAHGRACNRHGRAWHVSIIWPRVGLRNIDLDDARPCLQTARSCWSAWSCSFQHGRASCSMVVLWSAWPCVMSGKLVFMIPASFELRFAHRFRLQICLFKIYLTLLKLSSENLLRFRVFARFLVKLCLRITFASFVRFYFRFRTHSSFHHT